jgi:proteasome lid subunit RPN8/RPN11
MSESASTLSLADGVGAAIVDHARRTYPHECCGALIGRADVVLQAFELPNTTEEGPRRRFLVRPDDYRRAEQRARAVEADLLGFYHSHPDAPARPSQYDLDHAWPTLSYIIVSVIAGEAMAATCWQLAADRSAFAEQPLSGETIAGTTATSVESTPTVR